MHGILNYSTDQGMSLTSNDGFGRYKEKFKSTLSCVICGKQLKKKLSEKTTEHS